MKIVVGLGNPGKRYENTPHNVGFAVVEELGRRLTCRLRRSLRFRARLGQARLGGEDVLLVAPQTYMNDSGLAVGAILRYRKVSPQDLIVVLDDADLGLGRLRIRRKGSSGGHRGLDSVIQSVGGSEFSRVRIGIGRREDVGALVSHVLTPFSPQEQREVAPVIDRAVDAARCLIESGIDEAMNRFNS